MIPPPRSKPIPPPPKLPSRPLPRCTQAPQLPEIEDEDEDSTATNNTTKQTRSSVGSGGGHATADDARSLSLTSSSMSVLPAANKLALASIEAAFVDDESSPVQKSDVVRLMPMAGVASKASSAPNQTVVDVEPAAGTMVASMSTLSSWSSTNSVATKTNTDNPTSMSHFVTNFNITRTAAAAAVNSASSSATSSVSRRRGPSRRDRAGQTNDDPDMEGQEDGESTPLRVFKTTPV
jgi:hypothetical protein